MSIVFKILHDPKEIRKLEDLQIAIWGREEAVPAHQLLAAAKNGGIVIGVYDIQSEKDCEPETSEEQALGNPIGFSYAFVGTDGNRIWLYSHMSGLLRDYRGRNLGFKLKCFQRETALQKGYQIIKWTYDPLFVANGRLNIGKLGGIVGQYEPDYYGELRDPFNAGLPSDRCIVEWHIGSEHVKDVLSGTNRLTLDEISDIPKAIAIEYDGNKISPGTLDLSVENERIVFPFPKDFGRIKKEDPSCALRWRLTARKVFLTYLRKGYVLADALIGKKAAYYVFYRKERLRLSQDR